MKIVLALFATFLPGTTCTTPPVRSVRSNSTSIVNNNTVPTFSPNLRLNSNDNSLPLLLSSVETIEKNDRVLAVSNSAEDGKDTVSVIMASNSTDVEKKGETLGTIAVSHSTNSKVTTSNMHKRRRMVRFINRERQSHGLPPLQWSPDLRVESQRWSNYMATTGNFHHRYPLRQNIDPGWRRITENIAYHWSVEYSGAHTMLMNSPGHRRNILDPNVNHVGVGIRKKDGMFYVTQIFKQL